MAPIYLDYNATTPVASEVLEEMLPYLKGCFGNPSSVHSYGVQNRKAVALARERVAALINCEPDEVVFTSGGSESNNYAIKGVAYSLKHKGRHIVTSKIEHPAVLEVFTFLEREGFRATYVGVDGYGTVDLGELRRSIDSQTILVSIMHSNNEVGTIQPVETISEIARTKRVLFHCDAAQSLGKISIDVKKLEVDLLSIAGHKFYAPKGIGALYIRRGVRLERLIHGAAHEMGRRAGTENVAYVVALGKACDIARRHMEENIKNLVQRRDELYNGLKKHIPDVKLNGHPEDRLPNTLNVSFPGIDSSTLLSELTDIAASSGAACHSGRGEEASYVLSAMGVGEALGAVRFSVGRETTKSEITKALDMIVKAYFRLRKVGPQKDRTEPIKDEIKLTRYTKGLGCACKIRPDVLERIVKSLPSAADGKVLVGPDSSDDAAVYKIDEKRAIVQTVDFFTPVVDDPASFGEIAAANSLSDIYAMGARPLFALNVVGFPSRRLPVEVLERILEGARKKGAEAGIDIIGGHTIDDDEPKYGLAVTGIVDPAKIYKNSAAKAGDSLVLTKPIGTGIITTALKHGMTDEKTQGRVIDVMAGLNKAASLAMTESSANACTDVTGFGLLGHALEMCRASGVDFTIWSRGVPIIEGARRLAEMGSHPGGTLANLKFVESYVIWDESIDDVSRILLCDAQTSGGLLISIPGKDAQDFVKGLKQSGVEDTKIIGAVGTGSGRIRVE